MFVNDEQSGQDQRLLLGKKTEEIGDQNWNVGEPGALGSGFGFRETQIEQKRQKEKDAQLKSVMAAIQATDSVCIGCRAKRPAAIRESRRSRKRRSATAKTSKTTAMCRARFIR